MNWVFAIVPLVLLLSVKGAHVEITDSLISLAIRADLSPASLSNFLTKDRQRVNSLILSRSTDRHSKRAASSNVSITNTGVAYTANVGIGCPPTQYTITVDSSTAFTSINTYKPTACSQQIIPPPGTAGKAYTDTITLSPSLVATGQDILVPSNPVGIDLLGLGPGNGSLVTRLFNQGQIPADNLAYSFAPSNQTSNINGELTFGGVDPSKFTGNVTFTPAASTLLEEGLWGFTQSVHYGSGTPIMSSTGGIVDTGTTLLYLATDAFQKYQAATGAVLDRSTGFLKVTNAQLSAMKSLFFVVEGIAFEFTANAQLFPRALNTFIGGTSTGNYLIISDLGATGINIPGVGFINGFTWMERFYTVLDNGNERISFANTPFTNATVN